MATVRLKNVNPLGQVDLPIAARQGEPVGEHGSGCLEPGEVFEVPADIAGRPPKLNKDGSYVLDEETGEPVDVGEGLLAQWTNYQLVKPPKTKPAFAKKTAARQPASPPPAPASSGAEPSTEA